MIALEDELQSYIFTFLDIPEILAISSTCRQFHRLIRDTPPVQLTLHHHLNGTSPAIDSGHKTAAQNILGIHELRANLQALRPTIEPVDLPDGHEIFQIWGEYMVTRPVSAGEPHEGYFHDHFEEADFEDHVERMLCSIIHKGTRKDVKVNFDADPEVFAIDLAQDLLVVGHKLTSGYDERVHFFHAFNPTSSPVEYVPGSVSIGLRDWYKSKRPQIMSGQRIMFGEAGWFKIYDLAKCDFLGRLPPDNHGAWGSVSSWTVTHNSLLVGVDHPIMMKGGEIDDRRDIASLAVFNLDAFPPPADRMCIPDLLLELPWGPKVLPYVVRDLLRLPEYTPVDTATEDETPEMLDSSNSNVILISIGFRVGMYPPGARQSLRIAVPVKALRELQAGMIKQEIIFADHLDNPHRGGVWESQVNPFKGVNRILFSRWRHKAHVWVESDIWPLYEALEVQSGFNHVSLDRSPITRQGRLKLVMRDMKADDFLLKPQEGNWGCLKKPNHAEHHKRFLDVLETKAEDKSGSRVNPEQYSRVVTRPSASSRPPTLGSSRAQGTLKLCEGGLERVRMAYDGRRMVVQGHRARAGTNASWDDYENGYQSEAWVLDFGG